MVDRSTSGQRHARLTEVVHQGRLDCRPVEVALTHFDACFHCVGMSSAGMGEAQYTELAHDMTRAWLNPPMTHAWVSAAGVDSSEAGSSMWARVRGCTENTLPQLPFKAACMLRPGIIQPLHGIRSRTGACRWLYRLGAPLLLLRRLLPDTVRTEALGHAMLAAARRSASRAVLETVDVSAPGHPA